MGKKSKKNNKTQDGHPQLINVENPELRNGAESKKEKRKRNIDSVIAEETKSEEVIKSNTLADTNVKKNKKKKNRPDLNEPEVDPLSNKLDNDITDIHLNTTKKKKKKDRLSGKESQEQSVEACVPVEDHNDVPKIEEGKQEKKKTRNKAKTEAPMLNGEEAQVTEEDINKFCDELDEEDNKQYEEWVKLLDARLSKKLPRKK